MPESYEIMRPANEPRHAPRLTCVQRDRVEALRDKMRASLSERDSTAFEIVADLIRPENLDSPMSAWALEVVLGCLDHLALKGEVAKIEGTDPQRWMSGSKPEVDQT